jgi:hypothetical protein
MRKWVSAAALLVALVAPRDVLADTPASVYSDYAEDGVLSCGHSRAALKGVLNDASIYQYGDPYTAVGLKLAVRKQLAGGCRRTEEPPPPTGSSEERGTGTRTPSGAGEDEGARNSSPRGRESPEDSGSAAGDEGPDVFVDDPPEDREDGWMVLLGVGLLLVTLGSGAWAARRAFTDQP